MSRKTSPRSSNQAVVGLAFIVVGSLLLLDNLDLLRVGDISRFWPLIIIAIGLARMIDPSPKERRESSGLWLVMIGTWLQLNTLHILRWRDSWPLLIVALGINMVSRAFLSAEPAPTAPQLGPDLLPTDYAGNRWPDVPSPAPMDATHEQPASGSAPPGERTDGR